VRPVWCLESESNPSTHAISPSAVVVLVKTAPGVRMRSDWRRGGTDQLLKVIGKYRSVSWSGSELHLAIIMMTCMIDIIDIW